MEPQQEASYEFAACGSYSTVVLSTISLDLTLQTEASLVLINAVLFPERYWWGGGGGGSGGRGNYT